jgi:hypothetical protein
MREEDTVGYRRHRGLGRLTGATAALSAHTRTTPQGSASAHSQALRTSPEWADVDREIDMRPLRTAT